MEADLSQAEARIVGLLSDDKWLMRMFAEKKDVHSITASWFTGKEDPNDPENPKRHPKYPDGITDEERFTGKTSRYALIYDAKKRRLTRTINTDARKFGIKILMTEREAQRIINIFHDRSPNIKNVYHQEILYIIKRDKKVLKNCFGWPRTFYGFWDPSLYYNFIPQSSVADHTSASIIRITNRIPIEIILESHDAIVWQCWESESKEYAEIVREEMMKPLNFDLSSIPKGELIIPVDVKIGHNYKELEEFKF